MYANPERVLIPSRSVLRRPPVPAGRPPGSTRQMLALPQWRNLFVWYLVEEKSGSVDNIDCWLAIESVRDAIRDARVRADRYATSIAQILRTARVVPTETD
jgi:hypothetical protein